MCGASPLHHVFLVWCPESHSSILENYIALAIILWKSWSNLLSLSLSVHGTYLPVQYTHTQHFWHNFQEKCCQAWNLVILAILLYSPLLPPILICWTFWLDGLNKLTNLKFFRMPSHCLCTALLFAMHLLTGLLGIGWWGKSTDAKIYSAWNQLVARYISLQKECT